MMMMVSDRKRLVVIRAAYKEIEMMFIFGWPGHRINVGLRNKARKGITCSNLFLSIDKGVCV
jgi:hypothetical protein